MKTGAADISATPGAKVDDGEEEMGIDALTDPKTKPHIQENTKMLPGVTKTKEPKIDSSGNLAAGATKLTDSPTTDINTGTMDFLYNYNTETKSDEDTENKSAPKKDSGKSASDPSHATLGSKKGVSGRSKNAKKLPAATNTPAGNTRSATARNTRSATARNTRPATRSATAGKQHDSHI